MISIPILLLSIKANFNYASSTNGSIILETFPVLKHPSSILSTNPDNYLLSECKPLSMKIKLTDEIFITSIELQNCEWLSNFVTKIKLYITNDDIYIGTFKLLPTRNKIKIKVLKAEYTSILRIEFVEFKGEHDYFALSHLKVFGKTLMQGMMELKKKNVKSIGFNKNSQMMRRKVGKNVVKVVSQKSVGMFKYCILLIGVIIVIVILIRMLLGNYRKRIIKE